MNREIKFRRFAKGCNEMVYSDGIYLENFFRVVDNNPNNYEIMQYTGLKDKNGKEIYEGDVVFRKSNDETLEVSMVKGCWALENKTFLYFTINMNIEDSRINSCEVIGNIFENPELLKGEKS